MKKKKSGETGNDLSYSKARQELERILEDLEEGKIGIDKLAETVEKAWELIKFCKEKLESQAAKVKKIAKELEEESKEEEERDGGGLEF